MQKTVAIDFDGVIHRYGKGWKDGTVYDQPNEGAFEYINELMRTGYNVVIISSRSPRQIREWLRHHSNGLIYMSNDDFMDRYYIGFPCSRNERLDILEREYQNKKQLQYRVEIVPFWKKFWDKNGVIGITRRKLPAVVYIDDRALKFEAFSSLPKSF